MSEHHTSACGEVRASRFVLVDKCGKERAVLELDQGEPVLRLIGSNGRVQIQLGIDRDGTTRLYLEGTDIATFASLGTGSNGSTTLEFGGGHRRIRASSNLTGQNPTIVLTNDQSHVVGSLP